MHVTNRLAILALLVSYTTSVSASAQCADWRSRTGLREVGAVNAMTRWDPDGAGPQAPVLVVAGHFDTINGVSGSPAESIALWDGATWTALPGLGPSSTVYALAVLHDGTLIAAGNFVNPGLNHVARWTGTAWAPLVGGGLDSTVFALAVMPNGDLIAGGAFTFAGGNAAAHIARWDGTIWSEILGGMDDWVFALAVMPSGRLVAAGLFTSAGGTLANHIAQWINGPTVFGWFSLVGGVNDDVTSLAVMPNGELVAAGWFTSAGGVTASRIARWNGASWAPLGSGLGGGLNTPPGVVEIHVLENGDLVAGGYFTAAGGNPANFVARWDGAAWSALAGGTGDWVFSFAEFEGSLMVGGYFSSAGGFAVQSIARWDGLHWLAIPGVMETGFLPHVDAITTWAGGVVLAGEFATSAIENRRVHNLIYWDGLELHDIGSVPFGVAAAVSVPTIAGTSDLIIGGSFATIDGVSGFNRIAKVNDTVGPGWTAMGAGFTDGEVRAIARHDGAIYAGGTFTLSGSTPVRRVARWNGTSWQPLGSGMNGGVNVLASYGGDLYAGGNFTNAGGEFTVGLARWNGTSWTGFGSILNGPANALTIYDDGGIPVLAVGGQFPGISGNPNLAWTDGTNWGTFGTGGTNGAVRALTVSNGTLVVGGDFTIAGGVNGTHLARFSGPASPPGAGTWTPWSGATDGPVHALATLINEIQVGGEFLSVRNSVLRTPFWARFSEDGIPWFAEQPVPQQVDCGGNAGFVVHSAASYGGLQYQWRRNGMPIAPGPTGTGSTITTNGVTLNIQNVGSADQAAYDCILSNACGATTSFAAVLAVTNCCPADLNEDGAIDLTDLAMLLSHFGATSGASHADGDLDGDHDVDLSDLATMLGSFGANCA